MIDIIITQGRISLVISYVLRKFSFKICHEILTEQDCHVNNTGLQWQMSKSWLETFQLL